VDRLCLHAASIAVPDWREGREGAARRFEAPLPEDFAEIVAALEDQGPARG
jgi:hypothetical protein